MSHLGQHRHGGNFRSDQVTVEVERGLKLGAWGIESSAGRSIHFRRDFSGRIIEIIDPSRKSIRYEYDSEGNLVSVTDRVKATTAFTHLVGAGRGSRSAY